MTNRGILLQIVGKGQNSRQNVYLGETTLSLATSVGIFPPNLIVAATNEPVILGNNFLSWKS